VNYDTRGRHMPLPKALNTSVVVGSLAYW